MATSRRTSPARDVDAVADRLHSAAIHLLRRLRVEDEALGISAPRLSVLSVLVFAGPMRIGALAATEQVEPPTMSRLVDGLQEDGYVRRDPTPTTPAPSSSAPPTPARPRSSKDGIGGFEPSPNSCGRSPRASSRRSVEASRCWSEPWSERVAHLTAFRHSRRRGGPPAGAHGGRRPPTSWWRSWDASPEYMIWSRIVHVIEAHRVPEFVQHGGAVRPPPGESRRGRGVVVHDHDGAHDLTVTSAGQVGEIHRDRMPAQAQPLPRGLVPAVVHPHDHDVGPQVVHAPLASVHAVEHRMQWRLVERRFVEHQPRRCGQSSEGFTGVPRRP